MPYSEKFWFHCKKRICHHQRHFLVLNYNRNAFATRAPGVPCRTPLGEIVFSDFFTGLKGPILLQEKNRGVVKEIRGEIGKSMGVESAPMYKFWLSQR